jgi:V-type H+-transporting ATPase subunit C
MLFRGTYLVKDLNDILVEPAVKSSDFLYSKYITTVVVIVPHSQIVDWE